MNKSKSSRRKVQPRANLRRILNRLKIQKKKIVFTNGCFDIIHPGHIATFEKAKSLGDIVVVAINSDASLKKLKGPKRPLVAQKARAAVLAALEAVDFVTFFGEQTPAEIISELRPDILVKGGDYQLDQIVGRECVKKVVRVPLVKGYSTTNLINKIIKLYGK